MSSLGHLRTQAIVSREPVDGKRRWVLENVILAPPLDDEVIVEMVATGICHTDLICGSSPDEALAMGLPSYPRILGHEGAGYVKSVGRRVTRVQPGDKVLLSFSYCSRCHSCQFGAPGYCREFSNINFSGSGNAFNKSEPDTSSESIEAIGGSFFGQSSFSRLSRVKETSVVNVTRLLDSEQDLKTLAPFGCGIQTGAGTITDLAGAVPADKVAIIGLGAVGLAAVMGANIKGCRTIIGIDRVASRLEMAKSLGATHLVNTELLTGSLADEIQRVTEGAGSTITVDATGVVSLIQQGVEFTANQGKMILLGVAPFDAGLELPIVSYMFTGKSILGSMEGGVNPEEYIPTMIRWYKSGRFPVDKLVKFYPVSDFHKAVRDMEDGRTIKPVLVW